MTPSEDLYSLIKSLSRNEKGYFKKYASRHVLKDGNRYVELFDAVDAQEKYDEAKIKSAFGKKRSKNFASEKNYLYRLILRALNEFNRGSSVDQQLRELLNTVEALFAKTLYGQCLRLLNKAEKLAVHYEKFNYITQIADWKFRVLPALGDMSQLKEYIREGARQKEEALEKYRNLGDYLLLESKIFHLTKTVGYPRTKTEEEKYRVLIHEPFLQHISKARSYWAKFHYYNIYNFYYDAIGKKEKLYQVRKQLVDFAETDQEKIQDNILKYLVALNNLVNAQDELNKTGEVQETLRKIRSVESKSMDIRIRIFVYSYTLEEAANLMRGHYEKNIAHLPEVMDGLKKFGAHLHKEYVMAFRYNYFYSFFGAGKFSESLKWLNEILNDPHVEYRAEIYALSRIMFLVLHYELNNETLLDYALKNARRFFAKRERLFKFEEIMISFIEELSALNTTKQVRAAFARLAQVIAGLKNDPYESQPFNFFDFESWVDSKITGRRFADIVREKAQR